MCHAQSNTESVHVRHRLNTGGCRHYRSHSTQNRTGLHRHQVSCHVMQWSTYFSNFRVVADGDRRDSWSHPVAAVMGRGVTAGLTPPHNFSKSSSIRANWRHVKVLYTPMSVSIYDTFSESVWIRIPLVVQLPSFFYFFWRSSGNQQYTQRRQVQPSVALL